MIKAAILTISDKGSKGERVDGTGPVIRKILEDNEYKVEYYKIIPDEMKEIEKELKYLSDNLKIELVLTNGGTGFSERDVTPEATRNVIEKYVPGIGEVMRGKSLEITPKAMLSRAIAGIRKKTLIINLPGSPKGAAENLGFVIPALKHGIEIMVGKASECARK
ncbi:MogA/MoaB family molybdenum cofactor biosynthesis protein [Oceanirhabdus sp. W0125-5]|uniref:MogA/MoaB family molybdenum cofactor biosynthesis protein n=1 Tax=Oceanirhabdus sp. W0125-5 TaxID=2999116 RepID=UPI0022F312CC|nr:MogA/MoaB family molybdenum cofactor biosynthesis protein [Oceanirhabdus sp. W0125-5]WBW99503.1 MogA/MoaB family molybdenum cofactor biosynthesis protein [Oceanirhabdus sp. W0125-5]